MGVFVRCGAQCAARGVAHLWIGDFEEYCGDPTRIAGLDRWIDHDRSCRERSIVHVETAVHSVQTGAIGYHRHFHLSIHDRLHHEPQPRAAIVGAARQRGPHRHRCCHILLLPISLRWWNRWWNSSHGGWHRHWTTLPPSRTSQPNRVDAGPSYRPFRGNPQPPPLRNTLRLPQFSIPHQHRRHIRNRKLHPLQLHPRTLRTGDILLGRRSGRIGPGFRIALPIAHLTHDRYHLQTLLYCDGIGVDDHDAVHEYYEFDTPCGVEWDYHECGY
mmetsp:Transcript_15604/g.19003  ORF Transcript_15604/g.19003 Transcript_15604/m.19003 type:complete len:272 (+) Transcript_15604:142-957(+)